MMKKTLGLIIVLLVSYWAVRSIFIPGYFPMHDDTQVARVVEMGKALREGQFPVRWVSDLGYGLGYPLFNFYGPLPYYIGGFLYAIGISGLAATKFMMGLGVIFAGVTMYLVVTDLLGVSAGIVAAAFYTYAPYHAVDIFVRGAVGEYWTLLFLPIIFWGFWRRRILVGSMGVAGLILSHTVLGYAGMLLIGLAALVSRMRKDVMLMIVLGLGLSAFFWLPAIAEMKFTDVSKVIGGAADFKNHFVCLGQLWNSQWGFGGSAPGCLDGLSFKIGKEHLIASLIAALGIFLFARDKQARKLVIVGIGILALSVFLMLPVSEPVWSVIPLFSYVQYPWRFLTFAIFSVSLITSCVVSVVRAPLFRWAAVLVLVLVVLMVEVKRFVPQYTYPVAKGSLETVQDLRFRVSKISDEYLPPEVVKPATVNDVMRDIIPPSDLYSVKVIENLDTYKKFEFHSGTTNIVRINVANFPGWKYMVNDSMVVPELDHGLPLITVPGGLTTVQMWFRDTPVRTVGNVVSFAALFLWLYLYDKRKKTIS